MAVTLLVASQKDNLKKNSLARSLFYLVMYNF